MKRTPTLMDTARERFIELASEGGLPEHEFMANMPGDPLCGWCAQSRSDAGQICPSRILHLVPDGVVWPVDSAQGVEAESN